jgi:hypothetical protein
MTRTRLAIAIAALITAPAFAASNTNTSSTTSAQADLSSGTKTTDGAYVAPLEKNSAKQSASSGKQAKADASTSSTTSANADVSSGTKSTDGAYVQPLTKNSSKQQASADCDHPQAGKLADKSTGQAKDHSASAVHSDCTTNTAATSGKKKSTKTAAAETK